MLAQKMDSATLSAVSASALRVGQDVTVPNKSAQKTARSKERAIMASANVSNPFQGRRVNSQTAHFRVGGMGPVILLLESASVSGCGVGHSATHALVQTIATVTDCVRRREPASVVLAGFKKTAQSTSVTRNVTMERAIGRQGNVFATLNTSQATAPRKSVQDKMLCAMRSSASVVQQGHGPNAIMGQASASVKVE